MLDFQLVQAPFRSGVEEGVDPKQVPFGTLLTAQNVEWEKSGRLQKRSGTTALSTGIVGGGSLSSADRLVVRGDELALIAAGNLYSYTSSGWVLRGEVPELGVEWKTLRDDIRGTQALDLAYLSDGRLVIAWVTGTVTAASAVGFLYYQIIDQASGVVTTAPTAVSANEAHPKFRLVSSGTSWAIFWLKTTGGNSNLMGTTSSSTSTLKTDGTTTTDTMALDAVVIGSEYVVGYTIAAGGIRLVRYNTSLAEQTTATVTSETSVALNSLSVAGASGEKLWVIYSAEGTRVTFAIHNPSTLAQTTAPTDIISAISLLERVTIGAVRSSANLCFVAYSYDEANEEGGVMVTKTISDTGSVTDGATSFMTRLLSKPFAVGSKLYVLAGTYMFSPALPQVESGETFIIEASLETATWKPVREVAKVEWLVGGYWAHGFVTTVPAVSATLSLAASPFIGSFATSNFSTYRTSFPRQGTRLLNITSGASKPEGMWGQCAIGEETYLNAGMFFGYDGVESLGYGFSHAFYINSAATNSSPTGGAMVAGVYIYTVYGERRSAVGVVHRSPVAIPKTVTVGGTTVGSVNLKVLPLSIGATQLSGRETIVPVYRTLVDGSVPQRLTVEPKFNIIFNNTSAQPLSLTDTASDADIAVGDSAVITLASRPVIYTEGGELEDHQPPSVVDTVVYRNRIFALLGDRMTVAFTKDHSSNPGTAPGFHPSQRMVFNDRLTGLEVMDERLVVFAERAIYYTSGDGPAPNGDPPSFDNPNKLQTDVGCTNARGLVSTPLGIMFVCGDEIHLLSRDLNVSWLSKPVQALLSTYPNVTSAVLVAEKNQVRFSCTTADLSSGVVLVFDYQERGWTHFVYGASLPIADACMHDGVYTFVTTSGVVYKESSATWLDNGAWVTSKIETAWVHAAGPLAYHAVRHFRIDGVSSSAHGLSISVGFNGNTTYQQGPKTWAEGTAGVTTPADSVTANVRIGTRRKCRSIRFKVEDSAPSSLGTGQGPKWSSMGIEVGIKKGLGRLPPAQRK